MMSAQEIAIRQRLKDDLPHYAARCLKIRSKSGAIIPLIFNSAQRYFHDKVEAQLKSTGRVRALLLKGRQMGQSTGIQARFMQKTTHRRGVRTQIQTHQQQATDNIFEIANRFYDNLPAVVKPEATTESAKELKFGGLDSSYAVSTAGTKGSGRSATIQLFHASEFAFWPNADEHMAGIFQAVPDEAGTEIIVETTANGVGGQFHKMWLTSDYLKIFIPWFWQAEYRKSAPDGFTLSDADREYQKLYKLDIEQMAWRAAKIVELESGWRFKQEYPATADEAFQTSTTNPFVTPEMVQKAMTTDLADIGKQYGAVIMAVDPARFGDDDSVITFRRGRRVFKQVVYHGLDLMQLAGQVARHVKVENPDLVVVDDAGLGGGLTDRLRELRVKVTAVNGGERAIDDEHYANRRAEMYGEMKKWLKDSPCVLPDDPVLSGELNSMQYTYDSKQRLQLEKKIEIKKRLGRSPDRADSLSMTFAEYVPDKNVPSDTDYMPVTHKTGRNKTGGY